ncbi:unnamed protein product [Tetraodon nigroviridis]|uniref:(spotted green pufferfish) hypothetical protein n=1 Tax=Tetraodon nigroviridis TaxID=99883 RepID=Q4RHL3_TETNG|nr:unnamed protein product [Tetraodon nigroviridis]
MQKQQLSRQVCTSEQQQPIRLERLVRIQPLWSVVEGKQGRCKTLSDSTVMRKKEILPHRTPSRPLFQTARSDVEDNASPANLGYGGKRGPLH